MDLWTEYEGKAIAGNYQLGSLLRSEGRSAFFRIGGGVQKEAVMRLTEAHFDQEEMLKRWQHVAAVKHDHLIAIRDMGQTTLDGVALTYAVLEPSDANLAEVLAERPLTATETLQVARAAVSVMSALHSSGLVHEHIEAANILAVGETVKLRSDCVRECVIDQEFSTAQDCQQLRKRDVQDVGVLLLQCLTQAKERQPGVSLPRPFEQIVPRAIDGSWGLAQIASALDPPAPAVAVPAATQKTSAPLVPAAVLHARAPQAQVAPEPLQPAVTFRPRNAVRALRRRPSGASPWVYAVGIVLLALLGWHFISGSSKPTAGTVRATPPKSNSPQTRVVAQPSAVSAPVHSVASIAAVGSNGGVHGWHVVAYTYNHERQAAAKVAQVTRRHAALQPQVFSPSGHAPYFVALGGVMSSGEAASLLHRARQSGLPRDTFMRNF